MGNFHGCRRPTVAVAVAITLLLVLSLSALLAPWLPLPDPGEQTSDRLAASSWNHWLGTDSLGRDILSRVIWGGRSSLMVGLFAVGVAFSIGVPIGVIGGYCGGWIDRFCAGVIEVLMAFPGILLALVIVAVTEPALWNVMIAVGVSQVPHYARQARASTLAVRQHDYVLASHSLGASTFFIVTRHVVPNILAPVIVVATMGLGGAILDAAGLTFLGLSGDPNRPEWGSMLTLDRERFLQQPWLVLAPGLAITGTVLAFNLLGDALRDRLDPR